MTTQDEVKIRIGVDHRAVASDMGDVRREIKKGADRVADQVGADSLIIRGSLEKGFKSTFNAITGLLGVSLIAVGYKLLDFWKDISKQIAENFYNVGATKIIGNALERDRQVWRKAVQERDKAVADAAKKLIETQKAAAEAYAKENEAAEAHFATFAAREGENSEKVRRLRRQDLDYQISAAEFNLQQAKMGDDRLKIAQAEIDLEKAKLALVKFENILRDEAAAKRAKEIADQNAANQPRRQKILDILGTGQFAGELSEISRLQGSAALAMRSGNTAWAQTDLAVAGQIWRSIEQRIAPQLQTPTKPEDVLKNQLLDALAPIKNPDGSLKVTVTNVE